MKKSWVLVAVLAAGVPSWATAQGMDDAIRYRQGIFEALKWNFRDMGVMIQGRKPFDKARFAKEAERVAALAKMPWEGFVKGSSKGEDVPTRARPEIWYDHDKFNTMMQALIDRSAELAVAAKTEDKDGLHHYYGRVAEACKSCHDDFRERD